MRLIFDDYLNIFSFDYIYSSFKFGLYIFLDGILPFVITSDSINATAYCEFFNCFFTRFNGTEAMLWSLTSKYNNVILFNMIDQFYM
jgi:hypothetical protein